MSRRVPNGKGSRTLTATLVSAIAKDLAQYVLELDRIATAYREESVPANETAARMDFCIDGLKKFPPAHAWPRAGADRKRLLFAAPTVVSGSINLPPVEHVILVGEMRRSKHEVRHTCFRNPDDRRIVYVISARDVDKIQGLRHDTTIWAVTGWVSDIYDDGRMYHQLRARFGPSCDHASEAINSLDWTTTRG